MLDKFVTRRRDNFSSEASSMAVGLGILVSHVHGYEDVSNTVLVSAALGLRLRLKKQQPLDILTSHPPEQSCYLKACFLCRKNFSSDEDIYMYRGDQGFCSVECRNRQIILDDKKELELSTKRMVAAYRRCSGVSGTGVFLDDLRRRNQHIPAQKVRAIFS